MACTTIVTTRYDLTRRVQHDDAIGLKPHGVIVDKAAFSKRSVPNNYEEYALSEYSKVKKTNGSIDQEIESLFIHMSL